ncbi:MAG: sensor histidine kinase, partial [Actinomycetota bacterium]
RIVAAQDAERRRMERDIHDGAQQQLVAMAVKLGLARALLGRDRLRAGAMLEELRSQASEAIETLRDLARGIYPPLLADQGVAAALRGHLAKVGIAASVEDRLEGARFDPQVEAAVYFCVREAIQNASKHAPGAALSIRLGAEGGELSFEVEDAGPGFDASSSRRGSGTQNMADRIEALGGSLRIESEPGKGTRVAGRVPARALDPVG